METTTFDITRNVTELLSTGITNFQAVILLYKFKCPSVRLFVQKLLLFSTFKNRCQVFYVKIQDINDVYSITHFPN